MALPMAVIMKYDIMPTESAKSEVTMRISVKNWSKKVVLRVLGARCRLRRLHTYVGLKTYLTTNPKRSFS